jgi:hypothetical protein
MAAIALALAFGIVSTTGVSNLVLLTDPSARCLDGTQPGYYYKKGTVNSFVLPADAASRVPQARCEMLQARRLRLTYRCPFRTMRP